MQACQEALKKYYPDEFTKFQLVLDRDDFVTEANINLGLTVAEQRVVELDKVLITVIRVLPIWQVQYCSTLVQDITD